MKTSHLLLIFSMALTGTLPLHAKPTITHTPVLNANPGQAITILAQIKSTPSPVKTAYLHFTQNRNSSPNRVKMNPTGVGGYFGTISPQFTHGSPELHYYIEATNANGELGETRWHTLKLGRIATTTPRTHTTRQQPTHPPIRHTPRAPQNQTLTAKKWFWPSVIGGGAVIVLGAVALSNGSGDSGETTSSGSGGPANSVQITSADNRTADNLTLPIEKTLDASLELSGKTVTGVRINLNYNPADDGPETFIVTYEGNTLIDTGATTLSGAETREATGTATALKIAVTTSQKGTVSGTHNFNWTATATFFFQP